MAYAVLTSTESGANSLTDINANFALAAEINSPTFTGTPTLPTGTIAVTQSAGDSSTKVATTAFTTGAITTAFSAASFPYNYDDGVYGESTDGSDPKGSSDTFTTHIFPTSATSFYVVNSSTGYCDTHAITTEWAAADRHRGMAIIGAYAYVWMYDTAGPYSFRLYRYSAASIASGGTLMTVAGQAFGAQTVSPSMYSDGTYLYFTHQAGGSTSGFIISKYSISDTTITFISNITCGSITPIGVYINPTTGDLTIHNNSDSKLRRYNSSGVIQATGLVGIVGLSGNQFAGTFYMQQASATSYTKITPP